MASYSVTNVDKDQVSEVVKGLVCEKNCIYVEVEYISDTDKYDVTGNDANP